MSVVWLHRVESELSQGPVELAGLASKSLRAICLAQSGDLVWVPESMLGPARRLQEYYASLGFGGRVRLTSDWPTTLLAEEGLDVLYFGQAGHELWPDSSRLLASLELNHKNKFLQLACDGEHRLVRLPTCFFNQAEMPPFFLSCLPMYLDQFLAYHPKMVVKAAISAGGKDVVMASGMDELMQVIRGPQFAGRDFQIQQYLEGAEFYGVQQAHRKNLVTRQVILDTHYVGADPLQPEDPLSQRLLESSARLRSSIACEGVSVFSLDFAVLPEAMGGGAYILECNPRYGATSYPWLVALRLGVDPRHWDYRYYKLKPGQDPIATLAPHSITKDNPTEGTLLIDWGVEDGSVGVMFLGRSGLRRHLHQICQRKFA